MNYILTLIFGALVAIAFLALGIWITLSAINYHFGRIADNMAQLTNVEAPTLTAAVSELSTAFEDSVEIPPLFSPRHPRKGDGRFLN